MYLRFDFQCFHRLGSRDSSKGRTYMHGISFYENVLSNKLFDHFQVILFCHSAEKCFVPTSQHSSSLENFRF